MKFSEILEIRNGKNQRNVENPNGKYPIYGSGGRMGWADDYICPADTVIIGRKGTINSPIYVDTPFWNVDTAFGLVPDPKIILPKYLYYFCRSFDFEALNTTVTIPSLTKANLLQIEIDVPSLEKQQAVVETLDVIETVLSLVQKQIFCLGQLVKSRFIEMFGDPVTNPMGWETVRLAELGELNRGVSKHRPRNAPELLNGPYPLVQTGDVANADTYIKEYSSTYSEIGLKQSRMWSKGTLCITIAANIAKTGILTFDACFPDSVVGFIAGERTNQLYIHHWFSFFQKILEEQAPQSAQKNINLQILSNLSVMIPPIDIQNQFADFVALADKSKLTLHRMMEQQKILQSALMQEYFGYAKA